MLSSQWLQMLDRKWRLSSSEQKILTTINPCSSQRKEVHFWNYFLSDFKQSEYFHGANVFYNTFNMQYTGHQKPAVIIGTTCFNRKYLNLLFNSCFYLFVFDSLNTAVNSHNYIYLNCMIIRHYKWPIPVVERSNARVYGRSLSETEGSNPSGCIDVCDSSVVCCQVDVSTTGRSLVQRSPTDCRSHCVCDHM